MTAGFMNVFIRKPVLILSVIFYFFCLFIQKCQWWQTGSSNDHWL